jgi:serine/threonine-protein kinase
MEASGQQIAARSVILGSLLASGLLCTSIAIEIIRDWQSHHTATPPLPQPILEQPIASSTPKPNPPPNSTTDVRPEPLTEASPQADEQMPNQMQKALSNNSVHNNSVSDNSVTIGIPGFPVGTSQSKVKAALGSPTLNVRGYWSNTRALAYKNIVPGRVSLGYLFDRDSGRLRQTEVAFAQSVAPQIMQLTLKEMLGDRTLVGIDRGLQKVYQRHTDTYSFQVSGLKGKIERDDRDRIYVGVWEADLH